MFAKTLLVLFIDKNHKNIGKKVLNNRYYSYKNEFANQEFVKCVIDTTASEFVFRPSGLQDCVKQEDEVYNYYKTEVDQTDEKEIKQLKLKSRRPVEFKFVIEDIKTDDEDDSV